MSLKEKFGARIKAHRIRLGLSQEKLGDECYVSKNAVSLWEKGGSYPDLECLPKLAKLFGCTIDSLFGYELDLPECQYWVILKEDVDFTDRNLYHSFYPVEQYDYDVDGERIVTVVSYDDDFPKQIQKYILSGRLVHIEYGKRNARVDGDDIVRSYDVSRDKIWVRESENGFTNQEALKEQVELGLIKLPSSFEQYIASTKET